MSHFRDRERPGWKAYGLSIVLTAGALALTYVLRPWLAENIYLLLLTSVFVSGWYGGLGPGLLATACSCVGSAYFLFRPIQSLGIEKAEDVLRLALFVLAAVIASTLNDRLRAAQRLATASARREREALGVAEQIARDLRGNQLELTDFFEESALPIHWEGPDGTILRANRAELELLGYTHDDYVGHDIREFHVDPHVIEEILARLAKGEALRNHPSRLRCKDGSIRHVLIDSNVRWENRRFVHSRCFTRDVTEQRKVDTRQTLHFEMTRILAESRTIEEVGRRTLGLVCENLDWAVGDLWVVDPASDVLRCAEIWNRPERPAPAFAADTQSRSFPPGIGMPGRIWKSGTAAWIPDLTKDDNFPRKATAERDGLRVACGFPILRRGEPIGVFEFFSRDPRERDEELMKFFADVGDRIGQFTERKRSEQRLRLLSEVSSILSEPLEEFGAIDRVMRFLVPALADRCSVHVLDDHEVRLLAEASKDSWIPGPKGDSEAASPRVLQVLREGKARLLPEVSETVQFEAAAVDDTQPFRRFPSFSEVCVPLSVHDRTFGVLSMGRVPPRPPFGGGDFALAQELARRCATALENARLHAAERRSRRQAEEALEHVSGLHAIAARLSTALTPSDVGRIILDLGAAESGAVGGAVFALAEEGAVLRLVQASGFESDAAEAFARLPMDEGSSLTRGIRARKTVWTESGEPPHPRLVFPDGTCGAWAVVPLVVGGRVLGAAVLAFAATPRLSEAGRSYMLALTRQCALAFERSLLFREVQQSSAEKTRFLAAISHDLRTPVNAVVLLSSLIRKDAEALGPSLSGRLVERCRRIESAATSFAELLNDLLDITSFEVGHRRMREEDFPLADVLAESAATLHSLARSKGLMLTVRCHDPRCGLRGDRTELVRVLMNLAGNAIKFTETGSVAIESEQDSDGRLRIHVRDTGPGIPAEHLPHLFDEFFQVENKERNRVQGSGLGLSIAARIVRALGGEIRVETSAGVGSTFTVVLPASRVLRMDDRREPVALSASALVPEGASLLIVDDDLVSTQALREILQESGHRVRVAGSGEEGLEMLEREGADIVLLDMMMPGLDGVEVIRRIRGRPRLASTRIVALTGDVTRERTQAVEAAGADAFLGKPLHLPTLLATIRAEMEEIRRPRISRSVLKSAATPRSPAGT